MTRPKLFAATSAILLVSAAAAFAQSSCPDGQKEDAVEQTIATADMLPNVRNSEGSLRYETTRLLSRGEKVLAEELPSNMCPAECAPKKGSTFILESIPRQFRSGYSTEAICLRKQQETKQAPFVRNKRFSSLEELNDWYNDFSQGKGEDGKALYSLCDGDCSPQYTSIISKQSGSYLVRAQVVCGPARDKSDNKYNLTLKRTWTCG